MTRVNQGPIVVLGANGQVGSALGGLLKSRAVLLDRKTADLSKPSSLPEALRPLNPSAVINAAAYTQVDLAEKEKDLAWAINAESPGILARFCAERGIPLVHYSTDYVFPGTGEKPWTEEDAVAPLNVYGASKLEGERRVEAAGGKWLTFRTSWVYDATGKNFLNTMLRLGKDRDTLKVVADQFGAPTYAPDLARATLQALEAAQSQSAFPSGIYHLCNSGVTTWHEFASAIFEKARASGMDLKVSQVLPIPASEYPTPARRPSNSRLSLSKVQRVFGVQMPNWRAGLNAAFKSKLP